MGCEGGGEGGGERGGNEGGGEGIDVLGEIDGEVGGGRLDRPTGVYHSPRIAAGFKAVPIITAERHARDANMETSFGRRYRLACSCACISCACDSEGCDWGWVRSSFLRRRYALLPPRPWSPLESPLYPASPIRDASSLTSSTPKDTVLLKGTASSLMRRPAAALGSTSRLKPAC